MRRFATSILAGAVLAGVAIPAAAAQAAPGGVKVSVVRSGLNNPRHLTLTGNGLWVAQAGAGGPAGTSNCVTGPSIGCCIAAPVRKRPTRFMAAISFR